jgi:uncharacterized RDD family membrane protein YckC
VSTVGIRPRLVALLCDMVVFFVAGFVVGLAGGASAGLRPFIFWLAADIAYHTVMEATLGATLGKLVVGLRVVDEHGDRISWGRSLVRNVIRPVDLLFCGLVGAAAISSSPTNQRLGDRAAGTYVVRAATATAAA